MLIEWMKSRPDLKKYNENRNNCDIYINPDLKGFDAASFTLKKIQKMIEIGENAGKAAEPSLKKLRKKVLSNEK